jgi:bla regulator protein blaR1
LKTISSALTFSVLVSAAALAVPVGLGLAQAAMDQSDWEKAAGAKMEFEVASIHLGEPGEFTPPNIALDTGNGRIPPGGQFHADFPLAVYITFAYKLWLTSEQMDTMLAHLPKWVATDRFVIDARAEGNPTKDQMRLMVRSLLADRFKLAAHFETQETPVLAMVLAKPGKLGPGLKPHDQGPPCDAPLPPASGKTPDVFPPNCDLYVMASGPNHTIRLGSRDTTMAQVADSLPGPGRLGRPVVDETGLTGTYDFVLNFAPKNYSSSPSPGTTVTLDSAGPTFLEAVKDQLGLKLIPKKAPVRILVIDHIEQPSPN